MGGAHLEMVIAQFLSDAERNDTGMVADRVIRSTLLHVPASSLRQIGKTCLIQHSLDRLNRMKLGLFSIKVNNSFAAFIMQTSLLSS